MEEQIGKLLEELEKRKDKIKITLGVIESGDYEGMPTSDYRITLDKKEIIFEKGHMVIYPGSEKKWNELDSYARERNRRIRIEEEDMGRHQQRYQQFYDHLERQSYRQRKQEEKAKNDTQTQREQTLKKQTESTLDSLLDDLK